MLSLSTFEIHYTGDEILSKAQEKEIRTALATYLEPNLEVIFKHFERMERSKSGKLKQFTSLLK